MRSMLIPVVYPPHDTPPPPAPPPDESPRREGDVPRLLYLVRALWLCFFPVGVVVAGMLFLMSVPQAQEALLALDAHWGQPLALVVAFALWLLLAWYVCRVLLDRRFKADTLGECVHPGFAERLRRWMPRALIPIGGLPVVVFFLAVPQERWVGAVLLLITAALLLFAIKRRVWLQRLTPGSWLYRVLELECRAEAMADMAREDRLTNLSRGLLALTLVLQWMLFSALLLWPEGTARAFGAPALVLAALGSWIVFGGVVLTYLPKVYLRVPLTPLPLVLFVLFAPLNDNHIVGRVGTGQASSNAPRLGVDVWLQQWLSGPGADGKRPLVLVAVSGGASRAAYWGSAALARLQELGEQESVNFADSVFTISGTSGGALAASTFVAALDARRQAADAATCSPWKLARAFTGQDHLATPVGLMLYPDLVQRLLPVDFPGWDRSLGLEEVWQRDWDRQVALRCPAKTPGTNPFAAPFTTFAGASARGGGWLPLLSLNTAALTRGQRVYQAHYRLHEADGIDLLDGTLDLDLDNLSLAQAVHNSARFPYISPAGTVRLKTPHHDGEQLDEGSTWDHLGDGGYVEASGALALLDVLRELEASGLLRECKPDEDCTQLLDRRRLRLVLLVNNPARADDWLCRDAPRGNNIPPVDPGRRRATAMGLPELLAPPSGILASNEARALDSQLELIKRVGGCGRVAELRLPKFKDRRDPSMNWMLNASSREQIDAALTESAKSNDPWGQAAQAQLSAHLKQVRQWFTLMH